MGSEGTEILSAEVPCDEQEDSGVELINVRLCCRYQKEPLPMLYPSEIPLEFRLSEKDLVTCMSVSRSWHRMSSDVWVRRFWAQSPVLGLYFNTVKPSLSPSPSHPSYWYGMRFISLYNYTYDEDNQVRNCLSLITPTYRFLEYKKKMQKYRHFSRLDDDTDDYLDGCNGLLLLLKSGSTTYHQFYVCNPITRQQVAIPKAGVHHRHEHFCAALAFDPAESPHHYRVVRIDYSESVSSSSTSASTTVQVDIFWSTYAQWVRHKVQLDPEFTEGFRSFNLCRHFVYLHGKLYSIAMSWKLLWIDLNTAVVKAGSLKLPTIPEDADNAVVGSCLGVSMDLLCYMKRDLSNNIRIWSYNINDLCDSGEWILKYSIPRSRLGWRRRIFLEYKKDTEDSVWFESYAISPSSDVLFFGTPKSISSYQLKSTKVEFVCETVESDIAAETAAGYYFPAFALRACFIPFCGSTTPLAIDSEGTEILSAEVSCHEQEDDGVEVINVRLCHRHQKETLPMVYPSEIPLEFRST